MITSDSTPGGKNVELTMTCEDAKALVTGLDDLRTWTWELPAVTQLRVALKSTIAARGREEAMSFEFRCPKCSAEPHSHGKGGCLSPGSDHCEGLICECDPTDLPRSEEPDHGTTLNNPCCEANCYHCGWGGTVPRKPKGLQAWERTALAAGWKMPEGRERELAKATK